MSLGEDLQADLAAGLAKFWPHVGEERLRQWLREQWPTLLSHFAVVIGRCVANEFGPDRVEEKR